MPKPQNIPFILQEGFPLVVVTEQPSPELCPCPHQAGSGLKGQVALGHRISFNSCRAKGKPLWQSAVIAALSHPMVAPLHLPPSCPLLLLSCRICAPASGQVTTHRAQSPQPPPALCPPTFPAPSSSSASTMSHPWNPRDLLLPWKGLIDSFFYQSRIFVLSHIFSFTSTVLFAVLSHGCSTS